MATNGEQPSVPTRLQKMLDKNNQNVNDDIGDFVKHVTPQDITSLRAWSLTNPVSKLVALFNTGANSNLIAVLALLSHNSG